jgi:hypothetical protein
VQPGLLPESVEVALAVEAPSATVSADGPVAVEIDGSSLAEPVLGSWRFESVGGRVLVVPPAGLGSPPRLLAPFVRGGGGAVTAVGAVLTAPANLVARVRAGQSVFGPVDLGVRDAGEIDILLSELTHGVPAGVPIRIEFEATSGEDVALVTLVLVPDAD